MHGRIKCSYECRNTLSYLALFVLSLKAIKKDKIECSATGQKMREKSSFSTRLFVSAEQQCNFFLHTNRAELIQIVILQHESQSSLTNLYLLLHCKYFPPQELQKIPVNHFQH